MSGPRLSIASLTGIVALIGLSLSSVLYASSPWAWFAVLAYYLALGVAPLGIAYRREHGRAFYLGFTFWIWSYLIGTSVPLESGPHVLVPRLLSWAYPRMIIEKRQAQQMTEVVFPMSALAGGQAFDDLGEEVEIRVSGDPTVYMGIRPTKNQNLSAFVKQTQSSLLAQAINEGKGIIVSRHQPGPPPPTPVDENSFYDVGNAVLGLLAGVVGGLVGRWLYASQERERPEEHGPARE